MIMQQTKVFNNLTLFNVMSVGRKGFFLVIACFFVAGCKNEYIPSAEILDSVVSFDVDVLSRDNQKQKLILEDTGRYKVTLLLRPTDSNKPPREGLQKRDFVLQGVVDILEHDLLVKTYDFSSKISSMNTGVALLELEAEKELTEEDMYFAIRFVDIDQDIKKYFSEVEVHVNRELKHSIYD